MKIGVFCSANENIDPDFFTLTKELGEWMASKKHTLVFGGTNMGLMNCIAKAAHEGGSQVIGIVPTIVEKNGRTSEYNDIEIPCDNLSDRKDMLLLQSDIIIALPGGIGTIDEVFTVAASHTIGYHNKKVILYNMKGFWNKLIETLDKLESDGFIRGNWHNYIAVANNFEEMCELLKL